MTWRAFVYGVILLGVAWFWVHEFRRAHACAAAGGVYARPFSMTASYRCLRGPAP